MSELLGSIQFLAPNGVAYIEDLQEPDAPPLWDSDEQAASASESSILLRVQHAIDGLSSFEVWEGEESEASSIPDMPESLVFDGNLTVRSGNLRVRDVNEWNSLVVGVEPGTARVKIFCDVEAEATRTVVAVIV